MKCLHCKGPMERKSAPFSVDRNGYHITWDAVPAWVCKQCGEPYFEAEEINHIQRALQKMDGEVNGLSKQHA